MDVMTFDSWVRQFEEQVEYRRATGDPSWQQVGTLHPAVIRSVQRFQTGENGDGASLIGKSERAGDPAYLAAVRLFVAEEQNHARLLEQVLIHAGAATIDGHWTDKIFILVRHASGLRLELMTLMVAEVVALRYYRALRDGASDQVLAEVAGRILADEERHVPFHIQRLRAGFAGMSRPALTVVAAGWWTLLLGATALVSVDHAGALRQLKLRPWRFFIEVAGLFRAVVTQVCQTAERAPAEA